MNNKFIKTIGIIFWAVIPPLLIITVNGGHYGNFLSIPSVIFAFFLPLLIQLGLKGSSIPFFLERYNKFAREKYSLILYRNSLILGIFLPLIFIILCVQDAFDDTPDNLGGLFAAAVITTFYYSILLIVVNIYSIVNQIKNKNTHFIYGHFPILFFATASFFIINSMQFLLLVASDIDFNTILESYSRTLSSIHVYLGREINTVASFVLYIGISYTIMNKLFKIRDFVSLSKIILMNLPLFVISHFIINQVLLLRRYGGHELDKIYWNEFSAFTNNTFQFSIVFILGLFILLVLQNLNEKSRVTIEKFEYVDERISNKIFSAFLVVIFFLGLLFMEYVEGSGIPMLFIYIATALSLIPIYITRQKNKIDFLVQDRTRLIKNEKDKTEKILFNVLPKKVAMELNDKGNVLPKGFNEVSVLFTDFKNFTNASSTMSPEKLVGELNAIFHLFDNIIESQGVEKIKTIGDSYMIASGVPNIDENHAKKCIETGSKMIEVLKERNKDKGIKWDMRIGIHSGSVVAGLVGKSRFTYDLWGDTVNIASRMESVSESNRINISGVTYDLVKNIYEFDYRGKVDVKGKGEIDMYFVNKKKDDIT